MFRKSILLLVLSAGLLFAGEPFNSVNSRDENLKTMWDLSLHYGSNISLRDSIEEAWVTGDKSPTKAMLFSAVVPGAGEFYSKAYFRGLGFLAMEGIGWLARSHFNNKGDQLEKDYKNFADEHWNLELWLDHLTDDDPETHEIWIYCQGVEGLSDGYYTYDSVLTSVGGYAEGMTPVKTRDYYENIGKYDQFSKGWDDSYDEFQNPLTDEDGNIIRDTPHRDKYLTMRRDSNKALKTAIQFTSFIMINHVVSAIDAVMAAKQYNIKQKLTWHLGVTTDVKGKKVNGIQISAVW